MKLLTKLGLAVLLSRTALGAQQPAALSPEPLTSAQQADFDLARKDFDAGQWAPARTRLLALYKQAPSHFEIAKFAAEASLNLDDSDSALSLLQPLTSAHADDWQASALLARTFAQSHRKTERDAELRRLTALRRDSTDKRFLQLTQILVEHIPVPTGRVDLFYSLAPWSPYHIYEMGRVFNPAGQQTERLTLESGDFDQPSWAKQHPKEAAAGERMFSLDGYTDQLSPAGEHTQTHFIYAFFDGRPSYDAVRDRMLSVVAGTSRPMSSRGGLPVPK